jgi:hypothetical protein
VSAVVDFGPLSVPVPDGWERLASSDNVAVIAAPVHPGALFRPNITLTIGTADGPVHVVSSQAIAAVLALQPRVQVIGVEPDDVLGLDGRTIEYGYDGAATWVCVRQWIGVVDGLQLHVTGSSAVEDFVDFVPMFRAVLRSTSVRTRS